MPQICFLIRTYSLVMEDHQIDNNHQQNLLKLTFLTNRRCHYKNQLILVNPD